jgi:hypothetical protein
MNKVTLLVAALLVATPGLALAQSAISDPTVPGSGYRIPQVARTSAQPLAAYPGDGYRILAVPRTSAQPLAALPANPNVPGDGYAITTTEQAPVVDAH